MEEKKLTPEEVSTLLEKSREEDLEIRNDNLNIKIVGLIFENKELNTAIELYLGRINELADEADNLKEQIEQLKSERDKYKTALEEVTDHFFSDFEDYEIVDILNIHALNVLKNAKQALRGN